MVDIIPITKEIKDSMELKKLENRRDEIKGFNNDIANQLNTVSEEVKTLQARAIELDGIRKQLMQQASVNNGALSEVTNWIDAIKKKENEEIKVEETTIVDEKVEDNKKSKSKK